MQQVKIRVGVSVVKAAVVSGKRTGHPFDAVLLNAEDKLTLVWCQFSSKQI